MKSKALTILCGAALLLPLAFLMGTAPGTLLSPPWMYAGYSQAGPPGTRTPNQWEYGIYSESESGYSWQEAGRRVQAASLADFFGQMGYSAGARADSRNNSASVVALNYLGAQGWDLAAVATGAGGDTYWLKRPQ
jgi:hypothetical protein